MELLQPNVGPPQPAARVGARRRADGGRARVVAAAQRVEEERLEGRRPGLDGKVDVLEATKGSDGTGMTGIGGDASVIVCVDECGVDPLCVGSGPAAWL